MELRITVDINPQFTEAICQFTEAICFLAAALGYPAQTMAQSLKETAAEVKRKREEKVWTGQELQKYCLELATVQNVIKIEDVISTLKKFKDKNGNGFQTVEDLVKQKTPEEVNKFVKMINEMVKK